MCTYMYTICTRVQTKMSCEIYSSIITANIYIVQCTCSSFIITIIYNNSEKVTILVKDTIKCSSIKDYTVLFQPLKGGQSSVLLL